MSTLRFQDDSGYQDSTPYACVPASHDYQLPKTSDSLQNLQLQKIVDDLHATVQKFERLAFGPDCPKPMSILGKFSCQQSGCFFRCKDYDDFSRHINQGFHCKFKIYRFGDQDLRRTSDSHHPTAEASSTSRFDFQGEKRARKEDPLEINTQFSVTVQNPSECSTLPNDCNDVIHAVEDLQHVATPDQNVLVVSGTHKSRITKYTARRKRIDLKEDAKFQCTLCPKYFTRASTLKEHTRIHNDEKPFRCDKCSKRFTRSKDCNRHQTIHRGDKKFVCRGVLDTGQEIGCRKGFVREDGLAAHLRAESVFKCLEPLLDTFAEHMISSTNEDDSTRKYCCQRPRGCGACFPHLKDLKEHLQSDIGKACARSRLATFAMSYLDHRRTKKTPPLVESALSESLGQQFKVTEVTKLPNVSFIASDMTSTHSYMHPSGFYSDMTGFMQPLTVQGTNSSFDHVESATYPFPETQAGDRQHEGELGAFEIETVQGYVSPHEFFKPPAIAEYAHYLGVKVEGYTPTKGVAGNIMQIKIRSLVSLQSAAFSVRIGQLEESDPHQQRINAMPASVKAEPIALASFYTYTISATIPHPRIQSQHSPVPVVLEIEGLRKYRGNRYELFDVGDFVYEGGCFKEG